jgi:hypothetical protein
MLNPSICRAIFFVTSAAVAIVLFWQAFAVPAPSFEPVGGARVPQATAALIAVLCAVVAILSWARHHTVAKSSRDNAKAVDFRGLLFLLVFAVYTAMLSFRLFGLGWLTAAFLISLQLIYREKKLSPMLIAILAAASFAIEFVFTRIFVIDVVTSF